ncbi:MAG: hypothetical protein A2170_00125 [Deltaproteobacteria bacterium RBG_13_53_10]|nr:MAG: hypothetical protein A2170_00125 [Deltaproteobacteria bacterium RBG_13_53_10]
MLTSSEIKKTKPSPENYPLRSLHISFKRLLFSLLITLGIIVFLFTQISLEDLSVLLKSIDPLCATWAAAGYLLAVFLRAVRYRQLLHSREVPLPQLFRISAFYHLSLMVLPSKLGELTYPYLLSRTGGTSITEGMASLIASRVYDFFIILLVFSFAAIGFRAYFNVELPIVLILSSVLIGIIVFGFLYVGPLLRVFSDLIGRFSRRMGAKGGRSFQWLQKKGYEMAEDFSAIQARRNYLPVMLTSLCSWLAIFSVFYAFMKGFGIEISFLRVVSGSTISVITNALPISGIGNWGTMEAGWSLGFLMAGLSKEKAIATGFGVHIALFVIAAVTGFICWIVPNILDVVRRRRQKQ